MAIGKDLSMGTGKAKFNDYMTTEWISNDNPKFNDMMMTTFMLQNANPEKDNNKQVSYFIEQPYGQIKMRLLLQSKNPTT